MIAERELTPSAEAMWQAVLHRDADADFVYAVQSTGIYCRPTCPSRRPRRDQVLFFSMPAAAREAGFRACLRCTPDAPADPTVELVRRACREIEASIDEHLTLAELGSRVGSSPFHLQRTFKRVMGVSPRQYADSCRLKRFKRELRAGRPVTAAVYDAGYGSTSRLYERAGPQLGMEPARYRRGGEGASIAYATTDSALGRLLVAATERGVCFVSLGTDDETLEARLRAEFPHADIRRDADPLATWVEALVRHLDGSEPHLDLPTDVRATAFQRRVWEELRAIPYGETRTYAEVARAIGRPTAVRAVARACATNPTAVVVPCHRVIGSDGRLTGYRWGIDRKAALLEHEQEGAGPA